MAINWRTIAPNLLARILFKNAITVWRTIRMSDQVYCRLQYHPPDPVKRCSIRRRASILLRVARIITISPNNKGRTRWTSVTISARRNAATRFRWADPDLGTSWDIRIHLKAVMTAHRHVFRAVCCSNDMFFIFFHNLFYLTSKFMIWSKFVWTHEKCVLMYW